MDGVDRARRESQVAIAGDFPSPDGVRVALAQLYAFMTDNYTKIIAMAARVVRSRRCGSLVDGSDLAHAVLGVLADRLSRSSTPEILAERVGKYCDLAYFYRALDNECIDIAQRQRRLVALSADASLPGGDEPHFELTDDRTVLQTVIDVLRARGDGSAPRPTCLTPLHVRCWQAVLGGRGAQAELARELDVSASRITQIKASAASKLHETLYVVGILGPNGALESWRMIESCLDVYDGLSGSDRLHSPGERARLAAAALSVTVKESTGQRVDAHAAADRYLQRRDKAALRGQVAASERARRQFESDFAASLHAAEAAQAAACGNPYPNCVLNCAAHNPVADRVVWNWTWR